MNTTEAQYYADNAHRLTEVDIHLLISQTGVPFGDISDEELSTCLEQNVLVLLTPNVIYCKGGDMYSFHLNKIYNTLKICTIINEIQTHKYNFDYPIVIWNNPDEHGHPHYDTDGNGHYHIRAAYYCKVNLKFAIHESP